MPSSNLLCAPEVIEMVRQSPSFARILDVGPGRGKYGVLLREYLGEGVQRIDAIEAWEPYITLRLRCLYDFIFVGSVILRPAEFFEAFDVVLMVDVIEHVSKEAGLALLDRIPGSVVICTPRDFFQNPEAEAIPPEKHRSHWTVQDFEAMPRCRTAYINEWGAVMAALGPA